MLSVKHNMLAWNANRQLGLNTSQSRTATEKLSSGYRINRAADDAAGLSISEKMRRQIRGLTQAAANAQDGISLVQSAEGALNEVHDMLHRAGELAVKAANGTLSDDEREMVDAEIQQLKAEIDTTANHTVFNELRLFPDNGLSPRNASALKTVSYELTCNLADGTVQVNDLTNPSSGTARAGLDVSSGSQLAEKIAKEYLPNAIKQIFDSFSSLEAATGSDNIKMALNISYIDGPGNTLAYAQYSYSHGGGRPISMSIKVDSADFSDADIGAGGSKEEILESTLAHELMHTVMQYNLTDGMSGRKGDKFPTWFVEGTAQLAGGGFTTGWNDELIYYASKLTDENDTSQDDNIKKFLQKYTMSGRPYGHGYLGAAYVGYLANGGGAVTGAGIAAGMDEVFADLLNGSSFADAVKKNSGKTEAELNALFRGGDANLTEFVRKLAVASKGGAGSVITPALTDGGTSILGDQIINNPNFQIDPDKIFIDYTSGAANIGLQVGAEAGQHIDIDLYQMSTDALGLSDLNTKTLAACDEAIHLIKNAIGYVSNVRSTYGAVQNRLEHTIANLENVVENTTAAESRIRDTDMASEMVRFSNNQILLQAGQSILAQANHQPEMLLRLLE